MPGRPKGIPSYCLHRPSGRAVVRIDGRDHYLGIFGTDASRQAYDRLIAEWLASGRRSPTPPEQVAEAAPIVNEILLAYVKHLEEHYRSPNGVSKEVVNIKLALRPVKQLYGESLAQNFGPLALKAVRQHMVDVQKLCRREVNKRVGRIKRVFKWAASEELLDGSVFEALRTVDGLKIGRTAARESEPVKPVDDTTVDATLPFVAPQVRAMIQLQRLTGMRPAEVTIMRLCDLDRSNEVWIYRPTHHKTSHLGIAKDVPLGPKAQAIIEPFLDRSSEEYLFSPREAEQWRNSERRPTFKSERKTKIYPSELRAREQRRLNRQPRESKRPKRDHYDTDSYRRAITYGIAKAKRSGVTITHWHPHQLRHTRATEVRRLYGVEAAQVALCHSRADVTEIYAERNFTLATRIARELG